MEHHVESVIRINAPVEKVWEVLDDFGGVDKFSIGVQQSSLIGDKASGLGAVRSCVFYDQTSLREEIIEYDKNKSLKLVLTHFTIPMKSMFAGFRAEQLSETTCEVTMYMDFVVKYGPLGALLGAVVMRPVMKSVHQKLLSGLAYHTVTGKTVGSELPSNDELAQALAS